MQVSEMKKELYPEFAAAMRFLRWVQAKPARKPLYPVAGLFLFFVAVPLSLLRYMRGSGGG